jgi:hypothetical protein
VGLRNDGLAGFAPAQVSPQHQDMEEETEHRRLAYTSLCDVGSKKVPAAAPPGRQGCPSTFPGVTATDRRRAKALLPIENAGGSA